MSSHHTHPHTVENAARLTPGAPLSVRELELCQRLAGRDEPTTAQVAARMGITLRTAERMTARAYAKLGCQTRVGLVWRLVDLGYLRWSAPDDERLLDAGRTHS